MSVEKESAAQAPAVPPPLASNRCQRAQRPGVCLWPSPTIPGFFALAPLLRDKRTRNAQSEFCRS